MIQAIVLAAAVACADTGKSGAVIMRQPFGARPVALGQAYSALGDDAFVLGYNPAGLGRLRESHFASQFLRGVEDTKLGQAVFATPISPSHAFGLSAATMDEGKIDLINDAGQNVGQTDLQRDLLIGLAYAYSRRGWSLGASGKFYRSVVTGDATTTGYAADLGGLYHMKAHGGQLTFAAAAANLGPAVKYSGGITTGSEKDPLPMTGRFGAAFSRRVLASDTIAVAVQSEQIFPEDASIQSVGFEYNYKGYSAVRLGYRIGPTGGLSMGVGAVFKGLSIDYGLFLVQALNNVQQLSLNYRFTIPGIRYEESPPSPIDQVEKRAREAIAAGQFFKAIDEIRRIEAIYPDGTRSNALRHSLEEKIQRFLLRGDRSPDRAYAAGYKAFMNKRFAEAVVEFRRVVETDVDNLEAPVYLKKAQQMAGQEEAQKKLQRQATVSTLYELADKAADAGDMSRALKLILEIRKIADFPPAEKLEKRLLEGKSRKKAVARRAAAIKVERKYATPEDIQRADALYWQAIRFYAAGDLQETLRCLNEGLQLNPAADNLRVTLEYIKREADQRKN